MKDPAAIFLDIDNLVTVLEAEYPLQEILEAHEEFIAVCEDLDGK